MNILYLSNVNLFTRNSIRNWILTFEIDNLLIRHSYHVDVNRFVLNVNVAAQNECYRTQRAFDAIIHAIIAIVKSYQMHSIFRLFLAFNVVNKKSIHNLA